MREVGRGTRGRGHMYTYGGFMLLHGKNHHNIIKYYKLKITYTFYTKVINTQNTKKKKKILEFSPVLHLHWQVVCLPRNHQ